MMPSYCAEHPLDLCPTGKVLQPYGSTTSRQLVEGVKRFAPKSEIRVGTMVVDIVKEGSHCVGAKIMDVDTKVMSYVRARKGVVFGSGGFSHNDELMRINFEFPINGTCAATTNSGDLVLICQRNSIPLSGMNHSWLKQVVLPSKRGEFRSVFFQNGDSFLTCDRTGRRFACEKNFYQERAYQMIDDENRKFVFYIFDQRNRDLYEGPVKCLGGLIPAKGSGDDALVYGNTVTELTHGIAKKLEEIDSKFTLEKKFCKRLAEQLDRFNEFAKSGIDLEFHRGESVPEYCWHTPRGKDNNFPNKTMHPIDTSQLYALVMGVGTIDTKGGPRINGSGQILDGNSQSIPGLYGAGNCIRSFTNRSYPASGFTLSSATLFGYLSGSHAMAPNSTRL